MYVHKVDKKVVPNLPEEFEKMDKKFKNEKDKKRY